MNHNLWKTNPAEAGNQCADQVDGWVDPWFVIEPCSIFNDTDDINIFMEMREKTNALNPPLTSGMLLKLFFSPKKTIKPLI